MICFSFLSVKWDATVHPVLQKLLKSDHFVCEVYMTVS